LLNHLIIKQRLLRLVIFFFAAFWVIGIISPCFNFEFTRVLYPFLKQCYATVCHQNAVKSFTCNNIFFLVCARCTGIYAGTLISAFILMFYSKQFIFKTKYLIMLSLPMLLDVILLNLGAYNYNHLISALTGLLFGSSVFLYILSAIENLLFNKPNNNEL
jgi:uncharacterized membrane protein